MTSVVNFQNFSWHSFVPYQKAKIAFILVRVLPMMVQRRFMIDRPWYGKIAEKVMLPMLPSFVARINVFLTAEEASRNHPYLVLPKSITGLTSSKIKYLSASE